MHRRDFLSGGFGFGVAFKSPLTVAGNDRASFEYDDAMGEIERKGATIWKSFHHPGRWQMLPPMIKRNLHELLRIWLGYRRFDVPATYEERM